MKLNEIARINNLETISVGTSYGLKEGEAIVGFASFAEAKEFAENSGLRIASFKNEGGTSSCYQLYDENPCAGFDVLGNYENFTRFFKGDEEEFQSVDIDERIENEEFSEEEKAAFLKEMNAVKARIESLADDEFIYLDNSGVYSEPLKKEDTSALRDGDLYVIGVY